jgi:SAM-dependent methyltransferase
MKKPNKAIQKFDKYAFYERAVQSPALDAKFFYGLFRKHGKTKGSVLREDFCGTFKISCEWVKLNKQHKAVGVDLDPEPVNYGKQHHLAALTPDAQKRITLVQKDVRASVLPAADLAIATNFSYFTLRTRKDLLDYYRNCQRSLKPGGVFMMDCFGGPDNCTPIEEETKFPKFSYFWDLDDYDPVTNFARFYIHFRERGGRKIERAFTYEWRMWAIPEIREILLDAGFRDTAVYWEGSDRQGLGNGKFKRVERGEMCETWIAYIVAMK